MEQLIIINKSTWKDSTIEEIFEYCFSKLNEPHINVCWFWRDQLIFERVKEFGIDIDEPRGRTQENIKALISHVNSSFKDETIRSEYEIKQNA